MTTPPETIRHRDRSLAVILFMMALVFAPAAALHLAALAFEPAGAVALVAPAGAPG